MVSAAYVAHAKNMKANATDSFGLTHSAEHAVQACMSGRTKFVQTQRPHSMYSCNQLDWTVNVFTAAELADTRLSPNKACTQS